MKTLLLALILAPLLHACDSIIHDPPAEYLAIDLSAGPDAGRYPIGRYPGELIRVAPEGGWSTDFKTDKLLLRLIEAGSFTMGSPESEHDRRTNEVPHRVTLTRDFYIGVFEVTQRQWDLVMGQGKIEADIEQGSTRPIGKTSYVDAITFTATLSAKTGLPFTLPTEAQWEYACRAGTTTALNTGKDIFDCVSPAMAEAGRYKYNSNQAGHGKMIKTPGLPWGHNHVGSYKPNAWGLYDMHGNVAEWCLDWYSENLGADPATDPAGPDTGEMRAVRGGCWDSWACDCRSASRFGGNPAQLNCSPGQGCGYVGFRVLLPRVLLTQLFKNKTPREIQP